MQRFFQRNLNRSLILASLAILIPASSYAQIGVSITVAPPALPVYVQPACPGDGYMWTPGYWAWGPAGYYWVPGVWVMAPRVGFLWTPGYWGYAGGIYGWHAGYWGPHVGFYGGVNYGFGYAGVGFGGGVWAGSVFRYNTAVMSVNTAVVRNVYVDRTVINNTTVVNHTSFNGPGGLMARPNAGEMAAMREQHMQPTATQMSHQNFAAQDHNALASVNHGRPATTAMDHPNGQHFGSQGARSEVGQRQENQQQRVAQGLHNGTMTAGQAAHVETKEAQVNHQIANDRAANGGKLTHGEKQQVNKEQNANSKQIYKDKHEGK